MKANEATVKNMSWVNLGSITTLRIPWIDRLLSTRAINKGQYDDIYGQIEIKFHQKNIISRIIHGRIMKLEIE